MAFKSSRNLLASLVGGSIEFRFKSEDATSDKENLKQERKRIRNSVSMALETGGRLCILLLAELTLRYRNEPYYMAIRSEIEMRRYRPKVLEYMKFDSSQRSAILLELLQKSSSRDPNRDTLIEILRYFLENHPRYLKAYKPFLTREELLIVA